MDEFNIDELDFKPINKGLGFHHAEKEKIGQIKKGASAPIVSNIQATRQSTVTSGHSSHNNLHTGPISPELQAFYGQKPLHTFEKKNKEKVLITPVKKVFLASTAQLFGAWVVDFLAITSMMILLAFSFALTVNVSVTELVSQMKLIDAVVFFILFSIMYLSYFSILDLAQSPGKILLKLKLEGIDKGLTFKASLTRAAVSLVSVMLLGLPSLLDFSGKLSETRVVINE